MIFTTNKPLSAWGRVLHDPDLAQAILHRVLERGRLLELRGHSCRTRHSKLDLEQEPEPSSSSTARISGNPVPEFPEPTQDGSIGTQCMSCRDRRGAFGLPSFRRRENRSISRKSAKGILTSRFRQTLRYLGRLNRVPPSRATPKITSVKQHLEDFRR